MLNKPKEPNPVIDQTPARSNRRGEQHEQIADLKKTPAGAAYKPGQAGRGTGKGIEEIVS